VLSVQLATMVLCRLPTHQDATHAEPIRSNQQLETVAPARVSLQANSLLLMVQPMLIQLPLWKYLVLGVLTARME